VPSRTSAHTIAPAVARSGSDDAEDAFLDVLVIGAGPTGLTAAAEAVRHGLTVRIVDRKPSRSTFSKALVAHARTLEVFDTMGIADAVLAEGTRFAALNTHAGRRRRPARVDLLNLSWGDTAFPFWLSIPQYSTERILEEHLDALGGAVEWQVSLDDVRDHGDHVEARLVHADGTVEVARSRWLIGCDGGRSRVRDRVGLRLDRADAGATFVLADVKTTASLTEDEGYVFLAPEGLLLIVPMPEPKRWRIIAHAPDLTTDSTVAIDAAYIDDLIRTRSGLDFGSHDVTWESRFELSHGLADRYRQGRVFLAGDAAHIHSPVGGQGLNTGVQDAHNLLWKLGRARAMPDEHADVLLDSYEAERRVVARSMVDGVARVTSMLTTRHGLLRRVLGGFAPKIIARQAVRERLGRNVGMLEVAYPASPVIVGTSSSAGRRMPNPALRTGGRLYERLDPVRHSWVVWGRHGEAAPDYAAAGWRGLPVLFVPAEEVAVTTRDGRDHPDRVMLVRPDRYVAAAGPTEEAVWSAVETQPSMGVTRSAPVGRST
jgi:2-polyprenyl-6-methoxyphenol hydroxylase-like FAD-dependent oxidoreductase